MFGIKLLTLCACLRVVLTGDLGTPSLVYIYTGLSQPSMSPAVPQFTALAVMNGMVIDYYDSEIRKLVPKQQWMDEMQFENYWERRTRIAENTLKWLIATITVLMTRLQQDHSDIHILQWQQGCEGKKDHTGLMDVSGINMLNYDGSYIISFDSITKRWVTSNPPELYVKDLWSEIQIPEEGSVHNLDGDCMLWQETFHKRQQKYLETAPQPGVYIFAKKTKDEKKVMLTCQATGFYLKNITIRIRRDGVVLDNSHGMRTAAVLPNGDNTFQRKASVEIFNEDQSNFTCEGTQEETNFSQEVVWDHKPLGFDPIYLLHLLWFLPVIALIVFKCGHTKKSTTTAETNEMTDHNPQRANTPFEAIPSSDQVLGGDEQNSNRDSGYSFWTDKISGMGSEEDLDRSLSVLSTMDHEIDYSF